MGPAAVGAMICFANPVPSMNVQRAVHQPCSSRVA